MPKEEPKFKIGDEVYVYQISKKEVIKRVKKNNVIVPNIQYSFKGRGVVVNVRFVDFGKLLTNPIMSVPNYGNNFNEAKDKLKDIIYVVYLPEDDVYAGVIGFVGKVEKVKNKKYTQEEVDYYVDRYYLRKFADA